MKIECILEFYGEVNFKRKINMNGNETLNDLKKCVNQVNLIFV